VLFRSLPAAVRAFMVVNNTGTLLALLAAPVVFDTVGIAPAVVLCGLVTLSIGVTGWLRFGRSEQPVEELGAR
jgi:hypothetical protein